MSVRDRGYDPRTSNPRSGAHRLDGGSSPQGSPGSAAPSAGFLSSRGRGRRTGPGGKVVAAVATAIVVVLAAVGFSGGFHFGPASAQGGSPTASAANAASGGSAAIASQGSSASPSASVGTSSAPSATAPGIADVAIVPVTSFRTGKTATRAADVSGIAAGTSPFASLVLVKADAA
ncbi:MAG TPA: hypothetical protein VIR16_05440, partial [Candidatus Limnocylindrales bacterium]